MAVYQRGKNWYIDFMFHGQRIREMIGPSRKGAEKVIAKKKAEIAENKFLDVRKEPEAIKFYDFAKEYLQWAKANKKPSSYVRDLSLMRQLNSEFENKSIQEITTWQIEKYKAKRRGQIKRPDAVMGSFREAGKDGEEKEIFYVDYRNRAGERVRKTFRTNREDARMFVERSNSPLTPASVNRELALLKHMYSKAIEWGRVKESPTKKVKLLKGEVKRLRFLLPPEIQKLLSNCAGHLNPIVTVAVHTGMRKSELFGLKWNRVNFDQGIISVLDTKNTERRDIPMDETVKATLQALPRTGDHVFSNENGQGFGSVRKSFDSAVRKSGITDFRFHDLRHTFASNLVMEGVDIMTVKELMGHKDLTMTLRYAHLATNHKTRAINLLDEVFSRPQGEKIIEMEVEKPAAMSLNPPHIQAASDVVQLSP